MGELTRFWKLPEKYENLLLPYEAEIENFLYEKYQKANFKKKLLLYYSIKPLIPRFAQIFLRKKRARTIKNSFPNWPFDPSLEDLKRDALKNVNSEKIPFIWFWPNNKNFSFVITHDVESEPGLKNIRKICEIERDFGFRSSWNFVPERYKIPEGFINRLLNDGFEIGIHGLKHDGKLFNSKKKFNERISRIKQYAQKWHALGFRSPSLLRNAEWMGGLPFEYDSSFPDTDPFGPQPGGCLSIFPYFLGNIVELPVTLPQDHTLFEILKKKDISIWQKKIDWIEKMNGMVLIIVHPDYFNAKMEKYYIELLEYISNKKNFWAPCPIEICRWWLSRDSSELIYREGNLIIEGNAQKSGVVRWHCVQDGFMF